MKFRKITVRCTHDESETVAYALHECGSLGEVFDDYNDVKSVLEEKRWDYADASLFNPTDGCTVSGFYQTEMSEGEIASKFEECARSFAIDVSHILSEFETIDSAEWENEWKKYYKPFNIGDIVIIPEWIDYKPLGGDIPVYLNPGLAFGTGTHETTSMCVHLMQKLDLKNKRVLDFGCGSGILGICAHKLGASDVLYADNDEQAITATAYNCKINGITAPQLVCDDVRKIKEPADVVIANITADVLIAVAPIIKSALKNGGYAVISGIISTKADEVQAEYSKDFTLESVERKNEWSAFIFKL